MRPERWWSVILTMGLFMALSPLSAQAGPNRPFAPQPNHQAFTRPQPRAFANGGNSQPHRWQQPRGHAYGWNGQNRQWHQPRGNAHGWNGHQRQGHQPQGNAYGWNGQNRQGQSPQGNTHGWNGHQRQGHQPQGHAYGWNGNQRQGDQQRNVSGRNDHQWQQPSDRGQHNNPGSSYNRAGYPAHTQSPNIAPRSSGYSNNTTNPSGQTGAQPGFRHRDASGNTPVQGQSPAGVI